MSAAGQYYTVAWGKGCPAGSKPSSSSDAGFSPRVFAARPSLPGRATGSWVNHLGTHPFGVGALPTIAFTARQGGEGNCSELPGFNAVARRRALQARRLFPPSGPRAGTRRSLGGRSASGCYRPWSKGQSGPG